jgi:hypothetical protein
MGEFLADEIFSMTFHGDIAEEGRLDLYDLSISQYGLARNLAILGHFYQTGKVIAHAPKSTAQIFALPYEEGSFKSNVAAGVVATMLTAPFTLFVSHIWNKWIPAPDPQMQQVIELLQEQNELLREEQGLPPQKTDAEGAAEHEVEEFLKDHEEEELVIRSITANSFRDMFRPIGKSAHYVSLTAGKTRSPIGAVDPAAVNLIVSETVDPDSHTIEGVVNSFSRSSKTGIIFSQALGRGIQFADIAAAKLPRRDNYSWSQFTGKPIRLTGTYVYWFDGRVKRFLVEKSKRLGNE